MWKDILQAVCIVSLRWETHDTFLEEIDLKRSHLGDENIYAHVPFSTTYQQRIANVFLDDTLLVVLQILQIRYDWYFPAPGQISRLTNPHLFVLLTIDGLIGEIVDELLGLVGQTIRHRGEMVYFTKPTTISLY